jgi:hypothetical protein
MVENLVRRLLRKLVKRRPKTYVRRHWKKEVAQMQWENTGPPSTNQSLLKHVGAGEFHFPTKERTSLLLF